MSERFTPFYEWVAEMIVKKKLKLPEALVLCRVKMWGNAGCFEAYSTLAEKLGLGERTVIRAVSELISKGLIERRKKGNEKRLYFNFGWTGLELIDKSMPERHTKTARAAQKVCQSGTQLYSTRHYEETVELLADLLTTQNKGLSKSKQNQRRQLLLNQIENMK